MCLTSDKLDKFRRCPALYRHHAFQHVEQPDELLKAIRLFVLNNGKMHIHENYVVGDPINPWTGRVYARSAAAWSLRTAGKVVMTVDQFQLFDDMVDAVTHHPWVVDNLWYKAKQVSVEAVYCATKCKACIDWYAPEVGVVELHTCKNLDHFWKCVWDEGIIHKLAFSVTVARKAGAIDLDTAVYVIAVEEQDPQRTGVWRVNEDTLAKARRENEAAMLQIKKSLDKDVWPTWYEEYRDGCC